MKKIFLAATAVLAMFVCGAVTAQAKDKVVEHPVFTARNTTTIEVSRVVMSDTATVLHIYAKYYPKMWIRLDKRTTIIDNNGRRYALRAGDGITPGERLWMPESGEAEFRLIFEPVDPKAETVTLTEGEGVEGGLVICGIRLDGRKAFPAPKLPAGFAVHKADKKTALPAPVQGYGIATVKVRMLDYSPELAFRVSCGQSSIFREINTNPRPVEVPADGTLSFSMPVAGTTAVGIYSFLREPVMVFVEPGKTTEVCVNLRECMRRESEFHKHDKPYGLPVYVKGPLAAVAQEYAQYKDAVRSTTEADNIAGMSLADYKAILMKSRDETRAGWERVPASRATRELGLLDADFKTARRLIFAPSELSNAMLGKGMITREKFSACYDSIEKAMPADYIPRELVAKVNEPQALLSPAHINIIGSYFENRIAPLLGTKSGPYFTAGDAMTLYHRVTNDFEPLDDGQKSQLAVMPEGYRRIISDKNDELLKTIEEKKANTGYAVRDVPAVADSLLFDSIAARYRGKVVLVDVWETWCGPCRIGHESMAPMKKEFDGKDVVFVYFASESSPAATWNYMIADIPGDHYRLSKAQNSVIRKQFKITGVPTYIILDREGKKTYTSTGFPGVEKMRKEIENILGS